MVGERIMGGERACKTTARLAGLAYLVIIVTGFFSLIYVPTLQNRAGGSR
jgi:hypothetical protein